MITPSFALTATERVLPRMALDFTTAVLDPRVTFTRTGNTATVTNSSGVITAINANLPRFDYDATTLVCKGLLIEQSRTNLLLNSLLDGTNLATQSMTVTAAVHTLSFYGTGSVALSGTHVATVNGLGAYPTRTTLTFTPTAGSLTLTVTGDVKFANLELGAFATSFIPTAGATATRNADVATMTGTNFSSWYNATEGSLAIETTASANANTVYACISDGSQTANSFYFDNDSGSIRNITFSGSAAVSVLNLSSIGTVGASLKLCGAYKLNSFAGSKNAATPVTDSSGAVPVAPNELRIGSSPLNLPQTYVNGYVKKVLYWPQRLINAEVQAFSK